MDSINSKDYAIQLVQLNIFQLEGCAKHVFLALIIALHVQLWVVHLVKQVIYMKENAQIVLKAIFQIVMPVAYVQIIA